MMMMMIIIVIDTEISNCQQLNKLQS